MGIGEDSTKEKGTVGEDFGIGLESSKEKKELKMIWELGRIL